MPVMTWSGLYIEGDVSVSQLDDPAREWELGAAEGDLVDFPHDVLYGGKAPEGAVGSLPAGLVATPSDGSQPMVATSPIWLLPDDAGRVRGTCLCLCGGTPWQEQVGADPVPVELSVTEASSVGVNAYLAPRFGGVPATSAGLLAPAVVPDDAAGDGIDPDSELARMARAFGISVEGMSLLSAQHSWWIHMSLESGPRWEWINTRAALIDAGASLEAADGAKELITNPGWVEPPPASIMDALPSNTVIC